MKYFYKLLLIWIGLFTFCYWSSPFMMTVIASLNVGIFMVFFISFGIIGGFYGLIYFICDYPFYILEEWKRERERKYWLFGYANRYDYTNNPKKYF